ncbi:hypothetical protein DXG03_000478 [Asterophora parasitica]|uniref:Uncharacterized protein n=1 Tax=Asterophora parasitica TaxID=117018 RepID=A0A9P7GHX2_9AGAR|nr:hypothetical protein DXG03_000478 [Asterophora parasitica]
MAPTNKAKAKGVSASSFLDLKAELSKQEAEFSKSKAAGKANYIVGGVKRPDKKPTVWARQNKGLQGRAARDVELEEVSKPTLESARAALERKAKIYEKLRKGKTGGLNDKQYDALLVDQTSNNFDDDSDSDVDESVKLARAPETEDDPIVEYEDEFGRLRTGRRSEIPRELAPAPEEERDEDEDIIIRNPVNHFPVYEPSAERVAEVAAAYAEENNPLNIHYDSARENRAKGAGFYQFSGDEETRRRQMEELKAARDETGKVREELGAVDVRPGEVEGMRDVTKVARSRAMEKRKLDLEERRKLVDAKRRKVAGGSGKGASTSTASNDAPQVATPVAHVTVPPEDPLAALETSTMSARNKGKGKAPAASDADAFLAQLEHDFIRSKGR